MKIRSILSFVVSLVLLGALPGCCWSNCLKRCHSCTDACVVHEPLKPKRSKKMIRRTQAAQIIEQEEEEEII